MLLHVHSDTKGFDQLKSMIVFKFQIIFESSWRGVFSSLRRDMSVIVFVFDLRSLSPKYNMHPHISEMKLNIAANRELGIIILRQWREGSALVFLRDLQPYAKRENSSWVGASYRYRLKFWLLAVLSVKSRVPKCFSWKFCFEDIHIIVIYTTCTKKQDSHTSRPLS